MAKRLVILLVLIAAGVAGYFYYLRPPTELVLTGIVTTNDVILSAQIGGRIDELKVHEGDTVAAGQVVAVIAPDELRADSAYALHSAEGTTSQMAQAQAELRYEERQMVDQIRQAESNLAMVEAQQAVAVADLEASKLNFDRIQNLSKNGVSSGQENDQARTGYQAATARVDALKRQVEAQRATVSLARTNAEQVSVRKSQVQTSTHMQEAAAAQRAKADVRLAYTEVKAPFAGIVDVRAAQAGEVVSMGQPIVTVINPDDLWIRADVEETYIDRIRLGDRMHVRLPSGIDAECPVFYRGVDAGFATQRDVSRTKRDIKTFEVRLRCDNKDRRLAVGMTAYVSLSLVAQPPPAAPPQN